jgi:phytoene dehydrogenase-like protein
MDPLNINFDVIVVGSGLCGMVAAVSLAKTGKKVLLLEQHSVPGGYATSFKRKGFTFEVSLHQTSGLGNGQIINRLLSKLGVMEKIQAIRLDGAFSIKTDLGELKLDQEYISQLRSAFPSEREHLDSFESLLEHLWKESHRVMGLTFLPRWIYDAVARLAAPHIHALRKKSLGQCLDSFFDDDLLKELIGIQWQYYGSPIGEISAVLYLIAFGAFLKEGFYYIKGTSQSLSNALISQLESCGGTALFNHRVTGIMVDNGRATGVVSERSAMKGNSQVRFNAPIIISNSDPFATFESLLSGRMASLPSGYLERAREMDVSTTAVCAYIGLDRPFADFSGGSSHAAVDLRNDAQRVPATAFKGIRSGENRGFDMLTDYSSIDPTLAPKGKSALVAFRSELSDSWKGLTGEEYQARKRSIKREMESQLEKRYPGICGHIEHFELSTPLTMERYTGNRGGAFNGFAYSPGRVGSGRAGIGMKTPVKGLYLSSAWIGSASGGFFGSMITGYSTAVNICVWRKWFPELGKILFPLR